MANVCTGVTASWNGQPFGEVVEIKVNAGGSGLPLARASTWTFDAGTIDISCLSDDKLSPHDYGKKATLSIAGGGLAFSTKAICERVQLSGKVNDIARYAVTFKITPE
jgi:hypothetical protein